MIRWEYKRQIANRRERSAVGREKFLVQSGKLDAGTGLLEMGQNGHVLLGERAQAGDEAVESINEHEVLGMVEGELGLQALIELTVRIVRVGSAGS